MSAFQPSPYRPGTGLEPPYLGDRDGQIERFREFLTDPAHGRNVLVSGLRGVGKTVLLHHYSQLADVAGWLVVEREFSDADAQPPQFARILLSDLTRLVRKLSVSARVKAAAGSLATAVNEYLGSLSVSYEGLEIGISSRRVHGEATGRLDDDLFEALSRVGELCRRSEHPGFILRYDEFHVVRERPRWLTLSALLASVSAAQREEIPVMLVLSGLPPLLENLARAKSYTERMFYMEFLGNLEPPEDRAALADPAIRRDRRYEDDVIDAVIADTRGYPYFIQFYGDALWKGSPGAVITTADFARLRPAILKALDGSFFDARFVRASAQEQNVLRSIARYGESATLRELQRDVGRNNSQLQPLLASLTTKGLVYRPSRGVFAFTAPMFGAYISRRHAG